MGRLPSLPLLWSPEPPPHVPPHNHLTRNFQIFQSPTLRHPSLHHLWPPPSLQSLTRFHPSVRGAPQTLPTQMRPSNSKIKLGPARIATHKVPGSSSPHPPAPATCSRSRVRGPRCPSRTPGAPSSTLTARRVLPLGVVSAHRREPLRAEWARGPEKTAGYRDARPGACPPAGVPLGAGSGPAPWAYLESPASHGPAGAGQLHVRLRGCAVCPQPASLAGRGAPSLQLPLTWCKPAPATRAGPPIPVAPRRLREELPSEGGV